MGHLMPDVIYAKHGKIENSLASNSYFMAGFCLATALQCCCSTSSTNNNSFYTGKSKTSLIKSATYSGKYCIGRMQCFACGHKLNDFVCGFHENKWSVSE